MIFTGDNDEGCPGCQDTAKGHYYIILIINLNIDIINVYTCVSIMKIAIHIIFKTFIYSLVNKFDTIQTM